MTVGLTEGQILELSDDALDDEVTIRCHRKLSEESAIDFAAVASGVRAFHATRLFEWAVATGGIREFLFTHPEPHILKAVFEGYRHLGLVDHAAQLEGVLVPLAATQAVRREELGDDFENFIDPDEPDSHINALVVRHDEVRLAYVRCNTTEFTG